MTIQQLRYAITIADAGSMNRAAELLYVSQPTLSNAIHEIEKETGIAVFTRTNRGITLTEDGAEFIRYAQQVCQQYSLLEKRYLGKRAGREQFSISAQRDSFVAKAAAGAAKQIDFARIDLAIREGNAAEVIRDVSEQRSALGFLFRTEHGPEVLAELAAGNELERHPLCQCWICAYLRKDHPLAGSPFVTPDQLKPYPCLCFDQGDGYSASFAETFLGEQGQSCVIRVTDRAAMLELITALNGYALCPEIACTEQGADGLWAVPCRKDAHSEVLAAEIDYIQRRDCGISTLGEQFLREISRCASEAHHNLRERFDADRAE